MGLVGGILEAVFRKKLNSSGILEALWEDKMAIKQGKLMTQFVCPLCKTVWLLEDNEWSYAHPKNKESPDIIFYCNECNREVKSNIAAGLAVMVTNSEGMSIQYNDSLYYESDEESVFDINDGDD